MEFVVPWERLEILIGPYYTKPRKGRPQMPLSVMLRVYFLQQWYGLSTGWQWFAMQTMRGRSGGRGGALRHAFDVRFCRC